jgi:ribosomal protein S12 methylthiotransferase accessory factor
MDTRLNVSFPGNLVVETKNGAFTIRTDQPEESGGNNSAPSPSDLFTTSIAACAGYFALRFCRERHIETSDMSLNMSYDWNDATKRYGTFSIELKLPEGFPDKYRKAIIKAMDLCVVKQHIIDPPEFKVTAV